MVGNNIIVSLEQGSFVPGDTDDMADYKNPRQRLNKYLKDIWGFRTKVTVEPFIFAYMFPSVLAGLAVQTLGIEKACLVGMNYTTETCKHIMEGNKENYTLEDNIVQAMVSTATAWNHPLQTALPGILALFIGAWSDRTGKRRTFMVWPILSKFLSTIGLILSTWFYYQVGLNETFLIEGLPPVLTGGRLAMTMAVYSYVADVTTEADRTFRFGIVSATFTLSRPMALALSGIMTHSFGYCIVFVTACVFYLFGFVYIILRLKNRTAQTINKRNSPKVSVCSMSDPIATVKVAFKTRKGSRRLQIVLILFADIFVVGPFMSEVQMTYLFTRHQFNFNEVDFSIFLTYSVLVGIIGSIVTTYCFTKLWKLEDTVIGMIACTSRIAASVLYGLAPTSTVYFVGPALDMFSSAGGPSLKSMASKLVSSDEVGKISSLMSIVASLVSVVYSPMYSEVYNMHLESSTPGDFYFISTVLTLPAMLIMLTIFILQRREGNTESAVVSTELTENLDTLL